MTGWKSQIDINNPCWDGYRRLLGRLPADRFPDTGSLNACLPPGVANWNRQPIQFVPDSKLPGVSYEQHILRTGQVPTRENSWHDLFNALVWCRMPHLKASMNVIHCEQMERQKGSCRGGVRDALTLFDESGVIVQGTFPEGLEALARQDWSSALLTFREKWGKSMRVQVCGHAILEKFLDPYKSVTAHALLVLTPDGLSTAELDHKLAQSLIEKHWLESPAGLSPLPLAGLPGWWVSSPQDAAFYKDKAVFRPPSPGRLAAPVHSLY